LSFVLHAERAARSTLRFERFNFQKTTSTDIVTDPPIHHPSFTLKESSVCPFP
jgi:hypothetical protein